MSRSPRPQARDPRSRPGAESTGLRAACGHVGPQLVPRAGGAVMQEGSDAPQRQTLTPRGLSSIRQRAPYSCQNPCHREAVKAETGAGTGVSVAVHTPQPPSRTGWAPGQRGGRWTRNATSAPRAPPRRQRASSPRKRDPQTKGKSPPEGQLDRQACRCTHMCACTHTHTPAPRHACATLDPNSCGVAPR